MVNVIQTFHMTMVITKKQGCRSQDFGAINFSEYVQNILTNKPVNALIVRRISEKDETLEFGRSIKINFPSKVTSEEIREIISQIPGIDSSIKINVTTGS